MRKKYLSVLGILFISIAYGQVYPYQDPGYPDQGSYEDPMVEQDPNIALQDPQGVYGQNSNFGYPQDQFFEYPQGPELAYPDQGVGYPNQEMAYPNQEMSYPNQEIAYPNEGMGYPNQEIGYPNQGMAYPNQDMVYPTQEMAYPNQELAYPPNPNMGYPQDTNFAYPANPDAQFQYPNEMYQPYQGYGPNYGIQQPQQSPQSEWYIPSGAIPQGFELDESETDAKVGGPPEYGEYDQIDNIEGKLCSKLCSGTF